MTGAVVSAGGVTGGGTTGGGTSWANAGAMVDVTTTSETKSDKKNDAPFFILMFIVLHADSGFYTLSIHYGKSVTYRA
jgi:hypothetical protein